MKFIPRATLTLSLTLAVFGGCAALAATPAKVADGVLVGPNGMTLYTFDKDVAGSGKSNCNGPCTSNWPPFLAADSDIASGDYAVIMRDNGAKQWAVMGKPLYYWSKDSKPGDKTGDGFNQVWKAAKPIGMPSPAPKPMSSGY